MQELFKKFHKTIKVETDELREKRDILFDKLRSSFKKSGHPMPDLINQGSYSYGVGIKPLANGEYDIDVGLDFPIASNQFSARQVRQWALNAIGEHTKKILEKGPCIRVANAAGYHVDIVLYARFPVLSGPEELRLAHKDNIWVPSEPKKLKYYINEARQQFTSTRDSSGSDQLQRITRYLKRWKDLVCMRGKIANVSGLGILLLVINFLKRPHGNLHEQADDLSALIQVVGDISRVQGRIVAVKPTPQYEDVFGKVDDLSMILLKEEFRALGDDLLRLKLFPSQDDAKILQKHFGEDFPTYNETSLSEVPQSSQENSLARLSDMKRLITHFQSPVRPWTR